MYRLILGLLLAGCVADTPQSGFRPTSAPIFSNAVLQNPRLVGRWQQVADFAAAGAAACNSGGAEITSGSDGLQIAARLCLAGRSTSISGPMQNVGPGRFSVPGQVPWWVLWADDGYRTLVIGTPSGAFGFILNRDGALPADRARAAREVLDWNGYDLARLR
ncbi:MAG: apolipoprotein D and lipocalin family protein [Pseudorhodobacter sp.]|jgi:apolipoprotein D and lipocalin family protein